MNDVTIQICAFELGHGKNTYFGMFLYAIVYQNDVDKTFNELLISGANTSGMD